MDTTGRGSAALATPTPLAARSPAPDVARGAMLLLIAVANAPQPVGRDSVAARGGGPDRADPLARGRRRPDVPDVRLPVRGGIVQLHRRQRAAGVSRDEGGGCCAAGTGGWFAVGAVHALLLWSGDVIGAYGLIGLV